MDGGLVVIGRDEAGPIVDGGSDSDGRKWLAAVSKALGGSGDAQDGHAAAVRPRYQIRYRDSGFGPGSVNGGYLRRKHGTYYISL